MVERVKQFLAQGVECRIVTARVNSRMPFEHRHAHTGLIKQWCILHLGAELQVQAEKDYEMVLLYDDRAVAVQTDTGAVKGWMENVEVDAANAS